MIIKNINETKELAIKIADELKSVNGEVYLLLTGDLGAGKTTLTKQLIKSLGVEENVTSPTFNILNQYETTNNFIINHMDAYRLDKQSNIEMFLEEFDNNINIIEWWTNLNYDFDEFKNIKIEILVIDENTREIKIERNY
ncbi:tRNA (adenosine(37)-N6)-threonylcarbamoyltransferase complex ATPase subunit type 1 TsaE [Mesoplasma coleopterae]|uniref:tRNA (adenosine(37)-N6)-threonylcarbamoyltransferase complex ATPase subunit type 1 TsaE n=1 Tax=Mesoplasma coleopterae TaxID=324078 RepID=UPI000D045536|nr:tRNA (adenosine(37)-N6)-threonylcarbamoyltransferase complex ATPase subunit type 1 TsaE [Mesoplasma coleopterae]AVN62513.1 tRNA (adenosine(37)-N6)-threonylcarbamoyltransferase complex ATPase subunit type 1 TsaE [Mesoplasma coleopterae]AVN63189.1 tRNA (adenosine(37)-N6)-threonylcarbamoyltransferase complex ATPase subunit type 1 TsaE [Mesoplasma coleopterae]